MAEELSQLDIEVTERLHRMAMDKQIEIREEAAKAHRIRIASTAVIKDSHGRARKALKSSQTHVAVHQEVSQSWGTSSTHCGRSFCDQDDDDCNCQMQYDSNNVPDDVLRNNNSSLIPNWQSVIVHDMTPAELLITESNCDDDSNRATTALMSPPLSALCAFSVGKSVGSKGSYSRGSYNKKHQQRHHQQQLSVSILDNIQTSISKLDAKVEKMAKQIADYICGINTAIIKINAKLDVLSKEQMGANGVPLKTLQYSNQKDFER
ncbi:hypothetical protein BGZ95_001802 [Linnemannia exigua]|uniref:Uncharacterized protein n=1 Tax=Linnemannia exigua TaxID=604196 RepID=A0AAD4D6D6_9FUNG|nr:hypothetical protein BGZ95_001802 [Linnemannia exigua]